jgi:hypothetical protein
LFLTELSPLETSNPLRPSGIFSCSPELTGLSKLPATMADMSLGVEIPERGGNLPFLAAPPGNLSAISFNYYGRESGNT